MPKQTGRANPPPSFREKSTKTRIETGRPTFPRKPEPKVLEKNPPKQGLKLNIIRFLNPIKQVLEKNPPKQGLKPTFEMSLSSV